MFVKLSSFEWAFPAFGHSLMGKDTGACVRGSMIVLEKPSDDHPIGTLCYTRKIILLR